MQRTIEALATELTSLRQSDNTVTPPTPSPQPTADTRSVPKADAFKNQILGPNLGGDERDNKLAERPELFIQSRFQAFPLRGTDLSSAPSNFVLTRMESRWAGRISDKIGLGFELQYHPAPMGAAVELVNDAFVEYYASKQITIRAGQFVKPFGFAIQQSSSVREAPERGIFAGYFFPGQRDRGVLVALKLDELGSAWKGAQVSAGVLNGNRFFVDNNRQLNYNLRFRKLFSSVPLAVGVSVQLGKQLLPPGVNGSTNENLYGADGTVAPRVGLLKVMYFPGALGIRFGQTLAKSVAALQEENCDRLVIDLRGNIGGSLGFASLVSYLCPGYEPIGYSVTPKRLREGFSVSELPRVPMPRNRIEAITAVRDMTF